MMDSASTWKNRRATKAADLHLGAVNPQPHPPGGGVGEHVRVARTRRHSPAPPHPSPPTAPKRVQVELAPNRPGWDAQMLDVVVRLPAPARISMAPPAPCLIAPPDAPPRADAR